MEKYGFVYIWYDKKHKRFYIGSHWGLENDGYICSSRWMRNSFKRRPNDFKRKLLQSNIYDRKELLINEHKWLSLIKEEELGKKYYNLTNHLNGHWTADGIKLLTIGEKISIANKGDPKRSEWMRNRIVSDETKQKLRQANLGKKYSKEVNAKKGINNRVYDEEFKNKISYAAKNRSQETRIKISENNKRLHAEGKIGMKGKKHSPATIEKMKNAIKLRKSSRTI